MNFPQLITTFLSAGFGPTVGTRRDGYLGSGQGAVGSIRALLVREPPAAEAVHRVGGDGVTELLEGVVPVPALFDLVEQFGQLACHSVVWGRAGREEEALECWKNDEAAQRTTASAGTRPGAMLHSRHRGQRCTGKLH